MSDKTKKLPSSFSIIRGQFEMALEEEYIFFTAKELEDFAKTTPHGNRFILLVSSAYKKSGHFDVPTDNQDWDKKIKELTGLRDEQETESLDLQNMLRGCEVLVPNRRQPGR